MPMHTVEGGGGVQLHVRDWGDPGAPPILFLHGWSQHHLCWAKQFTSELSDSFRIMAMDLRGHGQSDAPLEAANYTTGVLWADDVAAVMASLGLAKPLLVGWSYGGLIIGDYLRKHGGSAIAGINLVAPAIGIGPAWFGPFIGPAFLDHAPAACSGDQAVALPAIQAFLRACLVKPVAARDRELAIGWTMLVLPEVRAGLLARDEDFRPEYAKFSKPMLVSYGAADTVLLPATAQALKAAAPGCRLSEYPDVGHAPFFEEPARFNRELAEFARDAFAQS
ncbi:alpha/beta hydrolase [Phenylobacterium sp. LjRoot219]|uniref:alpha/beta fold hydrolase n=1 Tax=Phenylobacterium sp. LjRoot219 TaxID=3342283 RepID=UPI003ED15AD2